MTPSTKGSIFLRTLYNIPPAHFQPQNTHMTAWPVMHCEVEPTSSMLTGDLTHTHMHLHSQCRRVNTVAQPEVGMTSSLLGSGLSTDIEEECDISSTSPSSEIGGNLGVRSVLADNEE